MHGEALLFAGACILLMCFAFEVGYFVGKGSQKPVLISTYISGNGSRKGYLLETRVVGALEQENASSTYLAKNEGHMHVLDQHGTHVYTNDTVSFYLEGKGVIYAKAIAFNDKGDVFVDHLALHGKTWEHDYYQRKGSEVCKVTGTNLKAGK